MVELEIYAAGVRNPDKVLGLALELDTEPGLVYKVDANHDIVYMQFSQEPPALSKILSIFRKLELEARVVGLVPPEISSSSKKKTQQIVI